MCNPRMPCWSRLASELEIITVVAEVLLHPPFGNGAHSSTSIPICKGVAPLEAKELRFGSDAGV